MITETAAMTCDEMAEAGIEPDPIYESRRKNESMKGFMARVEKIGLAHHAVSFHTDRPTVYGDSLAKEGQEAEWPTKYDGAVIEEVGKATQRFVPVKLNDPIVAASKGDTLILGDAYGKKTERRASLAQAALRVVDPVIEDVRRFAGQCATIEEMQEKVEGDLKLQPGNSREDVQKRWVHSLVRVPTTLLQLSVGFSSGISLLSPSVSLPCQPDLRYDRNTGIVKLPYSSVETLKL